MNEANKEMTRRSDNTPTGINRLLWWFSTTIPELVNDSTTDRNRASIIGLGVMFTYLYASVAWIYFWSLNVSEPLVYIALGLFIGFGILTIDRMLISSINKYRKNILAIGFRVLLALFLGAFIAQPLILWMFQQDIDTEIAIIQDGKALEKRNELESIYLAEKQELTARRDELTAGKDLRYAAFESAEAEYLKEIDGTGGSKRYGIAGIAAEKANAMNRAKEVSEEYDASIAGELSMIESRLLSINEGVSSGVEDFRTNRMTEGFLIRIEALRSLFDKDSSGALKKRYLLILVILVIFELLPLISKLFLPTGSYDEKVKIRDEIETEIAISNKARELHLKHLYNDLTREEDEELIKRFNGAIREKRYGRINASLDEWADSRNRSYDDLWVKIKSELLGKMEN